MIENEIKILDINHAVIMNHLEILWWQQQDIIHIYDRYYDTHDKSLEHNKLRMRMRSVNNETFCITKKTKLSDPSSPFKSMKEEDLIIKDYDEGHSILSGLGLLCMRTKEKHRISYHLEDLYFDFDFYPDIPPILEIEGSDHEQIQYRVRRLGLHYHPQVKRGSRKLFKHYSQ